MVKCSNCDEDGHNKRTCPLLKDDSSKKLIKKESKICNKVQDKNENKIKTNEKQKVKILEEVKIEKISWNKFKIENIPTTKKDATILVKQIYIDWKILSKLAEEVHEYDEYYGNSPNEWRIKPENLINEKKIDYAFLWNNYLEQYENIVKCNDLYEKGEKILLKVF